MMGIPAFCSYARRDRRYKVQLKKHLTQLLQSGLLDLWEDEQIRPGEEWRTEVDRRLEEAQIVILLLSPNFIASEECQRELARAMERQQAGLTRVIPILVRPVVLGMLSVANLQTLPRDLKPVVDWKPQDKAWVDVAEKLQAILQEEQHKAGTPSPGVPTTNAEPVQVLLEGIRSLPNDTASRVESFLRYYVGPPGAPFGGRTQALQHLNRWLDDVGAPPCFLLTAPGGQGKSALLAHWVTTLTSRTELGIVYFPVSIRFQTHSAGALFAALGSRLAALQNQPLSRRDRTVEEWHAFFRHALEKPLPSGRRLLLIVDGVDELLEREIGPALLPPLRPAGLKVVVAARELAGRTPAQWLQVLGWDRPGLATPFRIGPLDRGGIAEALEQAPSPARELLGQPEVLDELYRLTQGDPLLLGLYLQELSQQPTLSQGAARLWELRPGLEGYFARWMDEQHMLPPHEDSVHRRARSDLLAVLACALGPLSRKDLNLLLEPEVRQVLDAALRQSMRLLIGDGRHQGYTFTHPHLGEFVRERYLNSSEQQAWSRKFVAWGQRTVEDLEAGRLRPEEVSPYLVRYYGMHLELAGSEPQALLALVSDAWMRVARACDRTFASFSQDIERAWRAIRTVHEKQAREGAPISLADEVRCALARARLHGLTRNFTPPLIELLVRTGLWSHEEGLVNARRAPSTRQRAFGLLALSGCPSETNPVERQREALDVALSMSRRNDPALMEDKVELLNALVPHLDSSLLDRVLEAARGFEDVTDKVKILGAVARRMPDPTQRALVREALSVVRESPPEASLLVDPLARALKSPALLLEEKRQQRISNEVDVAMLGAELIRAHALNEPESRRALRIGENWKHAEKALLRLARAKRADRKAEHALAAWGCDEERASYIESADEIPEAALPSLLTKVSQLRYEWAQAAVLESIAHRLTPPLLDEALFIASSFFTFPRMRAKTLAVLAMRLDDAGQKARVANGAAEAASTLTDLEKLRTTAEALTQVLPEPERSQWLQSIGGTRRQIVPEKEAPKPAFPVIPDNMVASLLDLFLSLKPDAATVKAIEQLAPRLSPAQHEQVLAFIDTHDEGEKRSTANIKMEMLLALVPHLPGTLIPLAISCALSSGRIAAAEEGVLQALLNRVPDEESRQAEISTLVDFALETRDNHAIASVLAAISPFLSRPLAERVLTSLAKIPTLRTWIERARALAILVPALSPPARETAVRQALEALQKTGDRFDRGNVLVALAPHLPAKLTAHALELARGIAYLPTRVEALAALSQSSSLNSGEALLAEALIDAVQIERDDEFSEDRARQDALTSLIPLLARLSRHRRYELWSQALEVLSSRAREELLDDLPALAPVCLELGGTREVERIIQLLMAPVQEEPPPSQTRARPG